MRLKEIFILVVIVFAAAILRFYQLGQNPPSLDWDEASLGWNTYSILKTGSDEYGKSFPVSIRSFNDYKPPVYVYAAIPSVAVFGLNEFSVRLPSAIAGILTVLVTFFLIKSLTHNKLLSYLVTFLLAVSPWHIQFSRVAFEANLALFFFVIGATFLVYFLNRQKGIFLAVSFVSFVLSIYTYHSPRLVVPLFLAGIIVGYRKIFRKRWKAFLVSSLLSLALLYPLARNTLHVGSLQARFGTVSILGSDVALHNPAALPALFAKNYLSHFNFDFLFLTGDGINRHHAPDVGILYLVSAPFLLAGFFFLARKRPSWLYFALCWFLAAPVASALTASAPHAIRSLLFLPMFQLFIAYGFLNIYESFRQHFPSQQLYLLVMVILFSTNIFYYLHQYFVHLPVEYAPDWQYGYKQAIQKVIALRNQYDRVYFTSHYDQPYIYFLFYGRISPIVKNNTYFYKGMDKYEFSLEKRDKKGLYVIAPEDNIAEFSVFDRINFPDGKTAFIFGIIKK